MLYQLIKHGIRRKMICESGFAPKEAEWGLMLEKGNSALVKLSTKEHRKGRSFQKSPTLSTPEMRASKSRHFLCDNLQVALQYSPAKKESEEQEYTPAVLDEKEQEKLEGDYRRFVALHERAAEELTELSPLVRLLMNQTALGNLRNELFKQGAKPTEKITFAINGKWALDEEYWHEFWQKEHARICELREAAPNEMISVASGKLVTPAMTHLSVRMPGGFSSGSFLCPGDKDAFSSYGLSKGLLAAVSEEEAVQYKSALSTIIEESVSLVNLRIGYWFSKNVPKENDPLSFLFVGADEDTSALEAEAEARERLTALKSGKYPELLDVTYQMMCFANASPGSPRIAVKKFTLGTFEELINHIQSWFADLSINSIYTGLRSPYRKPDSLLYSLFVPDPKPPDKKPSDYIPEVVTQWIWDAATNGRPLPSMLYQRALKSITSDLYKKSDNKFDDRKFSIVKAYLLREQRRNNMPENITSGLNPEHPDPAYHCGRLLAQMDVLYQYAIDYTPNGVSIRHYRGFQAHPPLVLATLSDRSIIYKKKISRDKGALAQSLGTKVSEIIAKINSLSLPSRFTAMQRGLFALGFHQQQSHLALERTERIEAKMK